MDWGVGGGDQNSVMLICTERLDRVPGRQSPSALPPPGQCRARRPGVAPAGAAGAPGGGARGRTEEPGLGWLCFILQATLLVWTVA